MLFLQLRQGIRFKHIQPRLTTLQPSLISGRCVGPHAMKSPAMTGWLALGGLSLVGPTGGQILNFYFSIVSVLVSLWSTHLILAQCWIMIYMFSVLMH